MVSHSHSKIHPAFIRDAFLLAASGLLNGASDLSSEQNQPVLLSCQCVCWLRPQALVYPQNKSCDVCVFDAVSCWCASPMVSQANGYLKLCSAQSAEVWALVTRPPSDLTPQVL